MATAPVDPSGLHPAGQAASAAQAASARRAAALAGPSGAEKTGFKDMLARYLDQVGDLQNEADKAVRDLAAGRTDNLHQVIVAVNEADLSFRLMMQVRNKLVEAYKEIIRMQV